MIPFCNFFQRKIDVTMICGFSLKSSLIIYDNEVGYMDFIIIILMKTNLRVVTKYNNSQNNDF